MKTLLSLCILLLCSTASPVFAVDFDPYPPTGTIVSAVLNDATSLTVTLNANAQDQGIVCIQIYPFVCGDLEIALSYDGMNWTPWQQASTSKQYNITMTGSQETVYARLRDRAWNVSTYLSAPINIAGVCGSPNNSNYSTPPTSGLCTAGIASDVIGIGPWKWSCTGLNNGTTATCSAAQAGSIVYRSTDSGVNWTAGMTGLGFNDSILSLAISPIFASDQTLFLSGASGIYKSSDRGDTWTLVLPGYRGQVIAISPAFANDQTLFTVMNGYALYKSTDGGSSWTEINMGMTTNSAILALALSPNYASDHTMFAGFQYNGINLVYKSTDDGANWSEAKTGLSPGTNAIAFAISPNYKNDSTIFVATTAADYLSGGPPDQVYKSTNGGATWSLMAVFPRVITALNISPDYESDQTLIVGTTKGLFKSIDRGLSWTPQNSIQNITSVALSPVYAVDQTLFTGVYGTNVITSTDGGNSWSPSTSNFVVGKRLGPLAVSPAFGSDHTVFAATDLPGPSLSVAPTTLSFGAIKTNSSSPSRQITIKNNVSNGSNLVINGMTLTGIAANQFSIKPGSCGSLTPVILGGALCTVDVTFSPGSDGSKSAALQISSNGNSGYSYNTSLSGTGITLSSTITSPASGFATNTPGLTVSGTASLAGGDTLALVEISTDGGTTWQPATGTTTWSKDLSFPVEGIFKIKSRATTASGIVETPKTGISVTIDRTAPTGNIISAVLNDANLLSIALNTRANTPGMGCLDYLPIVCGYQDITLSYDGITWTPWQQAFATNMYNIAMTGPQVTIYAKLRDRVGNISEVLSAPVKFVGICGADNGKTFTGLVPVSLCEKGTASAVSGTGHPWSWTCQGDLGTIPVSCSASIRSFNLTVTIPDGTGKGDVLADVISNDGQPVSIYCPSSFCSAHFDFGRKVRLTATPDPISLFSAWEGACSANPCDIEMTADTAVTAIFTRDATFKNIRSGDLFNSLDLLLLSLNPGDEIRVLATELDVNSLVLDKTLTLSGGWKANHEAQAADPAVLNGSITIQDSDIRLDAITLRGKLAVHQGGTLRVTGVTLQP